jgi:hypothetical protein
VLGPSHPGRFARTTTFLLTAAHPMSKAAMPAGFCDIYVTPSLGAFALGFGKVRSPARPAGFYIGVSGTGVAEGAE